MNEDFAPIDELVLHRAPILLIEKVLAATATELTASVNTADSRLFFDEDGSVPSYVGIEYMAQAIAAFAGLEAKRQGRAPSLGFLLGARRYKAFIDSFTPNQHLHVHIREMMRDESNLVLFDCRITADGQLVASAQIKAIQPDNLEDVTRQLAQLA